jgi:integrase/recombinase XerD
MNLIDYLQKHYSSGSIKGYLQLIRRYELQTRNALTASYAEVLDYLGALRKTGLHPKSIRNHLAAIKIYYNYLEASGQRSDHPCRNLRLRDNINRSVKLEKLYSPEKLEQLDQAFTAAPLVEQIIISLLINHALTTGEIRRLNVEDIDLKKQKLIIRSGNYPGRRSNNERTLAMPDEQANLFNEYLQELRPRLANINSGKAQKRLLLTIKGLPLWSGYINRMLKQNAVGQLFQPQKIRQSVIVNLLKAGHDLRVVQVFAGHRLAGSTEQYQSNRLDELRSAIVKYHPLK